jgi:glycosyltransferase involved in cell wall biosynthesis
MLKDVTAVTVVYNTKSLFERAYTSFHRFYPEMKMVIVDNSDSLNPCAKYIQSLKSENTLVIAPGRNIGHGPGMDIGLKQVRTKYAVVFDSDTQIMRGCVGKMCDMMRADSFGVGKIVKVDPNGQNEKQLYSGLPRKRTTNYSNTKALKYYRLYAAPKRKTAIPYLHPYFHLVSVAAYLRLKPYIDHGAPCLATMSQIFNMGLSDKMLLEFPVEKYVIHRWRGTRRNDYSPYKFIKRKKRMLWT